MKRIALVSVLGLSLAACGADDAHQSNKQEQLGVDFGEDGKDDSATAPASIEDVAFGDVKTTDFSRTAKYRGFRFTGGAGQKVDMYVDGLRGLDTVLYLYKASATTGKPTGRPIASNDDTRSAGWTLRTNTTPNPYSSSVNDFALPAAGRYVMLATTYNQAYSGRAEVTVKSAPANQCSVDSDCDGMSPTYRCIGYFSCESAQCVYHCGTRPGGEGATCGGLRGAQCATGFYCDFAIDASCGFADQTGTCHAIPQVCTRDYRPVCGCNGQTYGNACSAHAAGISVASNGACAPAAGGEGATCGGLRGLQCNDGLFCNFGAHCGAGDQTGTCGRRPEVCTQQYQPVCGCDGRTYGNACSAASHGISVVSTGECAPVGGQQGATCGTRGAGPCAAGLFCQFPATANCGRADAPGTCQPQPQVCTQIYQPVCGCDGSTYGNSCVAASHGVSVDHTGTCP